MNFMNAETSGVPSGGAGRAFVDSNILLYAHDGSAGAKRDVARDLMESLWYRGGGYLSVQVLQEFFVNVTRKLERPLDIGEARQIVEDLSYWRVHRPGARDVLAAIDIHSRSEISFWDAMIVRSAAAQGCEVLYSEDLNSGQTYEGVKVVNPFADSGANAATDRD
jgi:predicted nucleic acid-binding protein